MKHIKLFEQFISEAVEISNPIDGKEVVIMPGRFQPFHKGHLAALENASKQFGKPVIPIQVISKKDTSPFPENLLQKIGDDVAKNESYIEKFFIYPRGYGLTVIPWFVRFLRDNGYETVGVAAGSDREKAYAGQMKYITSDKTDTLVSSDFEMKIVDQRVEGGPSGTKVREALAADDKQAFEQLVPKYLYKYYNELKKHIG
jgi:cytidyltransferase-like protein